MSKPLHEWPAWGTLPTLLLASCAGSDASGSGLSPASENASPNTAPATAPRVSDSDQPPQLLLDEAEPAKAAAPSEDQQCASDAYDAEPSPVVFSILLDQSGSMTEHSDRWTPVTAAVQAFVESQDSAGLVTSLQYFPLGKGQDEKCDGSSYASPAVDFTPLPSGAASIVASLASHHFTQAEAHDDEHSGTPTRAALRGGLTTLSGYLETNPDQRGYLLLATDGDPAGCDDNSVERVVEVIAEAAQQGILTYVIGIGETDHLQEMAEAGSSGSRAFIIDDSGENTEAQFLEALANIRNASLPCDFRLPNPEQGQVDLGQVNVRFRENVNGPLMELAQVPSAEDCRQGTWYYDTSGPRTRVALCEQACNTVQSSPNAQVEIAIGCATRTFKPAK